MLEIREINHTDRPTRHILRSLVERVAVLIWREPVTIVPTRQVARLRQLERQEMLMLAERTGNQHFLDQELEKVQLTQTDLDHGKKNLTPIDQWPDEDFEGALAPNSMTQIPVESSGPPASSAPAFR
jgi:hypothetical protein